jgi:hypothetical protein
LQREFGLVAPTLAGNDSSTFRPPHSVQSPRRTGRRKRAGRPATSDGRIDVPRAGAVQGDHFGIRLGIRGELFDEYACDRS